MPLDPLLRHGEVGGAPGDRAFVATFLLTFAGLTGALAALVRITDPLATFGGGLLPPVVSADRDYKAALYRAADPGPVIVVLGSSRVKTLRPACIESITGDPAFNFGVNAGVVEDYLAILRFMRTEPRFRVREILLGAEPEAFTGEPGAGRALRTSRRLRRYAPGLPAGAPPPVALTPTDYLGWESVSAALRSLGLRYLPAAELPQEAIAADGWQTHPRWDTELVAGAYPQHDRVAQSITAVSSRYRRELRLSQTRLSLLERFLHEAREAGVTVTAFIPPVHPDLERGLDGSVLPELTAQMVSVLRGAEARGLLRYLRPPGAPAYFADPALYYDAVHMMPANGDRLLTWIYRERGGGTCALQ